jgi:hypothetical protein
MAKNSLFCLSLGIKFFLFILVFLLAIPVFSQEKEAYDRKEEIIYAGKLYRRYNNYLTMGGGFMYSTLRPDIQRVLGFDYNFHIRRQYFQGGLAMSGIQFLSNNNIQIHMGYGLRKEKNRSNFALYGGVSYFTGVVGIIDSVRGSIPLYYQGIGAYFSAQAITKLTYDIGGGVELFGEYSKQQRILGVKFILFFSGSYRGLKKNYNPHVRSENKK